MSFLLGCIFGTILTSIIYFIIKVRETKKQKKEKKENE